MKKKLFRTACVAAVLAMALSFAGCGKDSDKSTSDSKKSSAPASTKASSSSAEFDSVEDFVNSSEFQSQLTQMKSSMSGSGVNLEIEAEGNTIVYKCTYETVARADFDDATIKGLEDNLTASAASYELVASSLEQATGEKDTAVKVVYLSSDGQVLAEKEFKAN